MVGLKIINKIVYNCIYDPSDLIQVSKPIRDSLKINEFSEIAILPYDKPQDAKILTLDICCFNVEYKEYKQIHESVLLEEIHKQLPNHYFYTNQHLLIQLSQPYLIIVRRGIGYATKSTKIAITSIDSNFDIISSGLLRRELFDPTFDFEHELGVGGMDTQLISICAIKSPMEKLGIKHVKGILLYGPPGTGKTLIARKLSKIITSQPPKVVSGPEVMNKYVRMQLIASVKKTFERFLKTH